MAKNRKELRYRAFCTDHNWGGKSRVDRPEAEKDLKAHIKFHPDEPHKNVGIHEIEV